MENTSLVVRRANPRLVPWNLRYGNNQWVPWEVQLLPVPATVRALEPSELLHAEPNHTKLHSTLLGNDISSILAPS